MSPISPPEPTGRGVCVAFVASERRRDMFATGLRSCPHLKLDLGSIAETQHGVIVAPSRATGLDPIAFRSPVAAEYFALALACEADALAVQT